MNHLEVQVQLEVAQAREAQVVLQEVEILEEEAEIQVEDNLY